MKRFLLLIYACIHAYTSSAQYPSYIVPFDSLFVSDIESVTFFDGSSEVSMEIPPWTIGGGWHTYFAHNGINTVTYSVPEAITPKEAINCADKGGYFATGPIEEDPWKRNYSGIYSAHQVQNPYAGTINIGFCHNENRNECKGGANSIDPSIPVDCNNDYQGYFAMVSAVWTPSSLGNDWGQQGYTNDLGPILWPSNGFVAGDGVTQVTQGLLQPSSIVYDGYIYVFVWDKGPMPGVPNEEGRGRGMKLVRVALADDLDPTKYEVYHKDTAGNAEWLPSLPSGFTKEHMLDFTTVKGPKTTDILPDELSAGTEAFRFTAAQINGLDYFIGLEEYIDDRDVTYQNGVAQPRHHLAIRYSPDLINWSARVKVIETSDSWAASAFNYPIFLSDDGWTNTALDLTSFYILGTHSQSPFINPINIMHIIDPGPASAPQSILAQAPVFRSGSNRAVATAYPNPTTGAVNVTYSIPQEANVGIRVMDMMGNVLYVQNLANMEAGSYTANFDLSAFPRGVYLIQVNGGGERLNFKVVHL